MAKETQPAAVAAAAVPETPPVAAVESPAVAVIETPPVAAVEAPAVAVVEPAPPEAPPTAASDEPVDWHVAELALERFVSLRGIAARNELAGCLEDEVRQIVAAARDRATAVSVIKAILSRAYDRRRETAAVEASADSADRRRSALAQAIVIGTLQLSAAAAYAETARLTAAEQEQIIALGEAATGESVGHVLKAAAARLAAK